MSTRPSNIIDDIIALVEATEPITDTSYAAPRSKGDRFRRYTGDLDAFNKERGFILQLMKGPTRDKELVLCGLRRLELLLTVTYMWTPNVYQRVADDAAVLEALFWQLQETIGSVLDSEPFEDIEIVTDSGGKRVLIELGFWLRYSHGVFVAPQDQSIPSLDFHLADNSQYLGVI